MADQQAQNDGAFDLILLIPLEERKANDAVKYYREVFGAELLKRRSEDKFNVGRYKPLLQVLLKLGSIKFLVVECFKEELVKAKANVRNYAIQLVYEGDPETVYRKALENGGAAITGPLSTGDFVDNDLGFKSFNKETNCFTSVKDPFGIIWTIAGTKIVTETGSSDNSTDSGTRSGDTTPAEIDQLK